MTRPIVIVFLLVSLAGMVSAQVRHRFIAITIDDLPVVSSRDDIESETKLTADLLASIAAAKVPAIGFVNENQLFDEGVRDEEQVDLLRRWLDAGFELGNHTFAHISFNETSLSDYEADILKGETITRELLRSRDKELHYFRHPYLHTGRNLKVKADLDKFLAEHGYTIAPVTIDNSDWIFARGYEKAFVAGDQELMKRIGAAYVPYLERKMIYWERQSRKLFGREIKQIMLLHANFINSAFFGDIAKMLEKRGYRFVSLGDALKDKAYRLPDRFTGASGISWLHRWAIARGKGYLVPGEPKTPDFVMSAAGVTSE